MIGEPSTKGVGPKIKANPKESGRPNVEIKFNPMVKSSNKILQCQLIEIWRWWYHVGWCACYIDFICMALITSTTTSTYFTWHLLSFMYVLITFTSSLVCGALKLATVPRKAHMPRLELDWNIQSTSIVRKMPCNIV
jgi:hypothetical protein